MPLLSCAGTEIDIFKGRSWEEEPGYSALYLEGLNQYGAKQRCYSWYSPCCPFRHIRPLVRAAHGAAIAPQLAWCTSMAQWWMLTLTESRKMSSILLVCTPTFSAIPYFKQKTKHFIYYASVQVGTAPSILSSELPRTSKSQNQCTWETLDIWFCLMELQEEFIKVQWSVGKPVQHSYAMCGLQWTCSTVFKYSNIAPTEFNCSSGC